MKDDEKRGLGVLDYDLYVSEKQLRDIKAFFKADEERVNKELAQMMEKGLQATTRKISNGIYATEFFFPQKDVEKLPSIDCGAVEGPSRGRGSDTTDRQEGPHGGQEGPAKREQSGVLKGGDDKKFWRSYGVVGWDANGSPEEKYGDEDGH